MLTVYTATRKNARTATASHGVVAVARSGFRARPQSMISASGKLDLASIVWFRPVISSRNQKMRTFVG